MSSAMESRAAAERDQETALESELLRNFAQWMEGVGPISDPRKIAAHPAYTRIVDMGKPAIPIILRHLKREPSLLAWTLFDITGTNPVRPSDSGKIDQITKTWIKWGKGNKYI
jgi:hypothetical protein